MYHCIICLQDHMCLLTMGAKTAGGRVKMAGSMHACMPKWQPRPILSGAQTPDARIQIPSKSRAGQGGRVKRKEKSLSQLENFPYFALLYFDFTIKGKTHAAKSTVHSTSDALQCNQSAHVPKRHHGNRGQSSPIHHVHAWTKLGFTDRVSNSLARSWYHASGA